MDCRTDDPIERLDIGAVSAAGRQRHIEVEPAPCAAAYIVRAAALDGIAGILMQRNREHARVLVKRVLGAVAVVHIPVDNGNPLDTVHGLRMLDGQSDIAENAKPAPSVGLGVMTARPDERISVIDTTLEHRVDSFEATADREPRELETAGAESSTFAGIPAVARAEHGDSIDIGGRVKTHKLLARRNARRDRREQVEQPARRDEALQTALRFGAIEGRMGLDPTVLRSAPCIVPCVALVPNKSGRHR
jgi:hypothetical protein